MHKRSTLAVVLAFGAAACSDANAPSPAARLAPFMQASGDLTAQVVPNEYIVVLRDRQRSDLPGALAQVRSLGGTVLHRYDDVFRGFAAQLPSEALTELRRNADVLFVEPNGVVRKDGTQAPTPSWGLDRIDQRNLPLNNSFTYNLDGTGVHEYTLDTGILLTHNDFAGRVGNGFDAVTPGGNANDCDGHGTHVTGTAAGTLYGVAKKATVHPVRVLNCAGSGTWAQVIAGMNWVKLNRIQPAVANMSLGGGVNAAVNMAADSMVNVGDVALAVSSGNNNTNACSQSPASAPAPLTVNASNKTDKRSNFSNYGPCSDVFAPGSNIVSDYIGSNNAIATLSGTSMATPHVTGALALYRQANPGLAAPQIFAKLLADATNNVVTNPGAGTPNKLLYIGNISGGGGNTPPVANFTSSCASIGGGLWQCDVNGSSSNDDVGVTGYTWSSPGKANKTGVTAFFKYPAGTWSITLTVVDGGGLSNAITKNVTVP